MREFKKNKKQNQIFSGRIRDLTRFTFTMFHIFSKRIRDCKKKKKNKRKKATIYCVDKTRSSTHTFHSHRVIFCFSCRFLRVSIHEEHQQQSQNYISMVCAEHRPLTRPPQRVKIRSRGEKRFPLERKCRRVVRVDGHLYTNSTHWKSTVLERVDTEWRGALYISIYLNYTLFAIHWLLLVWPIHIAKKRERAKQNLSLCDAWNTRIIK